MTKEQEEAIEILSDSNILFNIQRDTALSIRVAIETVLNLIQKQGKQIDFYKKGLERELEDNRKNTCELLKQDLIIREKDKQIDLILDVFFKRFTAQLVLEYGIENKEQLKQKFEQYFKRKAEQD